MPHESSRDSLMTVSVIVVIVVFIVVLLLVVVICFCSSCGTCPDVIRMLFAPPLRKHILLMRSNILYANGSEAPAKVSA
jgi:hypothetical protein